MLILIILTCMLLAGCAFTNEYRMESSDYGVFIGADKKTLNTILDDSVNYEIAVIEGQEFSADKRWQDYIAETLAKDLYGKDIDGFFIDNCDVYYQYHTAEIYDGLVNIMERLKKYDIEIIINGGNDFVSKLILDGKSELIDGVNQEGVFSSIKDYDNDVFAKQDKDETEYFLLGRVGWVSPG